MLLDGGEEGFLSSQQPVAICNSLQLDGALVAGMPTDGILLDSGLVGLFLLPAGPPAGTQEAGQLMRAPST